MMKLDTYIFSVVILFLGVFAQQLGGLDFFGVRTNIVLAALLAFSFCLEDRLQYLLLVFLAALSIRFHSLFSYETLVLVVIALVFFWLRTTRFEPKPALLFIFVIIATFVFYILLDPTFIWYGFIRVFLESLYNSILAFIIFQAVGWYAKKF